MYQDFNRKPFMDKQTNNVMIFDMTILWNVHNHIKGFKY